jgi:hypothetical protein
VSEPTNGDQQVPNDNPQGTEGQPPSTPQRPENVPEKFWDAEKGAVNTDALLQSYVELEKTKAKPQDPPQDPPQGDQQGTEGEPPQPKDQSEASLAAYNAAVEKATAELQSETGAISDETYAEFAKQGITKDQIDTYVEGQHAKFELRKIHVEREVGGEDAYAAMLQWAGANYSPEEADAYNQTVFGGSRDNALQAARSLKAKYEEAMGTDGKIVTDGTGKTQTGGYTSKAEWMADMRKPEYKKDPAFRDAVRKKLETSLQNGVNMGVGVSAG